MYKFLKYWAPLYLYAGLIFYFSSASRPLPGIDLPNLDKIIHIGEYAVFGLLAARALKNASNLVPGTNGLYVVIIAVVISALYGISDEVHQYFVAGRESSIYDIIADFIGGTLGAFLYGILKFHTTVGGLGDCRQSPKG